MKKLIICLTFIFISFINLSAQKELNRNNVNIFSVTSGICYPYYKALDANYTFSKPEFSFGASLGLKYVHFFTKSISISLNPQLDYSKFGLRQFEYEMRDSTNTIVYEQLSGETYYDHLSIKFPLSVNYKISNEFSLGIGSYLSRQLSGTEYYTSTGTIYYYYNPVYDKYIKYLFPIHTAVEDVYTDGPALINFYGWLINFTYILPGKTNRAKQVELEYYSNWTSSTAFNTREKLIKIKLSIQLTK
jgi:hypothetical protein